MQTLGCDGLLVSRDVANCVSKFLTMKPSKGTVLVGLDFDDIGNIPPVEFDGGVSN